MTRRQPGTYQVSPVLITGCAGLIGTAVCRRLRQAGRGMIATFWRTPPSRLDFGIDWRRADLREFGALDRLAPVEAIIHCAAALPASFTECQHEASINQAIDQNVLAAAERWQVPLVYASTAALYGDGLPRHSGGWCESDPITAYGPYLRGKAWTESRGLELRQRLGLHFTALRINAPYGAGQRSNTVLMKFVDQALAGGPLRYYGEGARMQDF